ncbi:calcium-binding protein [Sphingobium sp. SCG-1]|uniref:SMP-30/gluconolactonase/LRE family protein n=1 Tax=Sphingobium sp. SCG-1 TaxID=2072936 RepID=UPI000CD69B24|nr:SMP-30/gluconolactonase/LRE family protein [Sphingobium sp. SCG-1]AUW58170.1 calcium-binding protein [Sphingobium sp. SCG-1]
MRRVTPQLDHLGECPTWDERTGTFLWINVTGKKLLSCKPDGSEREELTVEDYPGSFALRENGGRLVAFRRKIALLNEVGREVSSHIPDVVAFDKERFNDGKCDSRGRFWVGTLDKHLQNTVGGLFRVDPDLSVHKMSEGYGISNGIAWSPDDKTLYHCDSSPTNVYAYDFDAEAGTVGNRRVFVEFEDGVSRPDGCATDSEGFLWIAAPGAGCIRRYDPDGKLESIVETPSRYPSSIAFGGADLRTLYITTLVPHALPPNDGAQPDIDGALFATEVAVPGLPVGRFGG